MKALLILGILSLISSANSFKQISLLDFSEYVSTYNNVNIYIDDDVNSSISLFVPDKIRDTDMLQLFEQTLNKKNYNLKKFSNNYYITKKTHYTDTHYKYKLKYNTFLDCKNLLDFHKVKYTFLKDTSTFLISTTAHKYKEIQELLQLTDTKKEQVTLKITIFEYNEGDLMERGISSLSKKDSKILRTGEDTQEEYITKLISSIIAPVTNPTLTYKSTDFNLALSYLDTKNFLKVLQNPTILVRNNDKFTFNAVDNIAFKTSSTTTESANTSTNESIQYKDVGLKISGVAFIYDDYVSLDLNLIVEDIISQTSDNIPQTYKRELNSPANVKFGDVLLLSGLKRTKREVNDYSIPYLSGIPYLGSIFQYKSESESLINISISIEVLN